MTAKIAVVDVEELRALVADAVASALADRHQDQQRPALLDRRGAAARLGIGVDTLDKLRRDGLPTIMVGDSPRFDLDDCIRWLKERKPTERDQ